MFTHMFHVCKIFPHAFIIPWKPLVGKYIHIQFSESLKTDVNQFKHPWTCWHIGGKNMVIWKMKLIWNMVLVGVSIFKLTVIFDWDYTMEETTSPLRRKMCGKLLPTTPGATCKSEDFFVHEIHCDLSFTLPFPHSQKRMDLTDLTIHGSNLTLWIQSYLLRRYKLPPNCTLSAFRAADPNGSIG